MEKTKIIILRDFAEQINVREGNYTPLEKTYYTKTNKWPQSRKLWLYIKFFEEYYEKYLFDEQAANYVIDRIEFNNVIWHDVSTGESSFIEKGKKYFSLDLMCKFNLVRIIPKGGSLHFESYKRVMLKDNYESAKPIFEEEIFKKTK